MMTILKNIIKFILPMSLLDLLRKIHAYRKSISTKKHIKFLLGKGNPLKLEIGAGSKKGKNGWLTLDMVEGCDIYWDLSKGLPFPDSSVEKIYSSHVFEHFTFKEGQKLLGECNRVLCSGGEFSICVPDAKKFILAYVGDNSFGKDECFSYKPAYNNTTSIDYVNYIAYMDGHHKYMFDEENIITYLKLGNFNKVSLRDFDQNLDLLSRDFESIYAYAIK